MVVIRKHFDFDRPKDVDKNLNCEIEFIIKINDFLAVSKVKNEIEQFLLKQKHGNDIQKHGKQQKK